MAVSMVAEAMAGVHDKLVGTTIGLKSISENLLKRVVLLPKGTEMRVNGLRPSSYLIPLMEQTGTRMELIWLEQNTEMHKINLGAFCLRTFAQIVSAHPYCARLRAQIHLPRHTSSARAKC